MCLLYHIVWDYDTVTNALFNTHRMIGLKAVWRNTGSLVHHKLSFLQLSLSKFLSAVLDFLAVATTTPSIFFLVSETIIQRESIRNLVFVVLAQRSWNERKKQSVTEDC